MKNFTSLFLFLGLTANLYAQSVTIGISGGYDVGIAGSFSPVTSTLVEIQTLPNYYAANRKIVNTSYGRGGNLAVSLDWFSKKDIGCGLKVNALIGSHFSFTDDVTYLNGVTAKFDYTDKPLFLQFIPYVAFKHDFKIVSPVIQMGMIVGVNSIEESYAAQNSYYTNIKSDIIMRGGVMLGFHSSLGLAFKVTRVFRITLAVNCGVGSYSPTKWGRKNFFVNGTSKMSSLTIADQQGVYVKDLDYTATQPTAEPSKSLKFSVPFSNVGFNVGFLFVIDTKKKPSQTDTDKGGFKGF